MKNLLGIILSARAHFIIFVSSVIILYLSIQIADNYNVFMDNKIFKEHLINYVLPFNSFLFVLKTSKIICYAQYLCLIVLLIPNKRNLPESITKRRSILFETFLITISFLNTALISLLILSANFIYSPSRLMLMLIVLSVIVITSTITYSLSSEDMENDEGKRSFFQMIQSHKWNYKFGNRFAIIISIYILLVIFNLFVTKITLETNSFTFLKYPIFLLSLIGIVYVLLGRYFQIKKMDEFERQIVFEINYLVNTIMIGVFLAFLAFTSIFHLDIKIDSFIVIISPILLLSAFIVRGKYE